MRRRKKIPKTSALKIITCLLVKSGLSLSGKVIGDEVLTLSNIFKAEQFYVQLFVKKKQT